MSGIGENLAAEIVSEVLFRSVKLAIRVANDARNFRQDQMEFHLRLMSEIPRLEYVNDMLKEEKIAQHIRDRDRHTYFHIVKNMHDLLLEYVITVSKTPEEK